MSKQLVIAVLGLVLTAPAAAAQVIVVANPSVGASAVSADELKGLYLLTKTTLHDGSAVEPVLAQGGAAHESFLAKFVGKDDQGFRNHLKGLVFTGKGTMPKSFASDAEVVRYVASKKGALGYVSAGADTTGVKKLDIK